MTKAHEGRSSGPYGGDKLNEDRIGTAVMQKDGGGDALLTICAHGGLVQINSVITIRLTPVEAKALRRGLSKAIRQAERNEASEPPVQS